jgi:GTPase SAR1 family protein
MTQSMKVIVLGTVNVGKSSLIKRFINEEFS